MPLRSLHPNRSDQTVQCFGISRSLSAVADCSSGSIMVSGIRRFSLLGLVLLAVVLMRAVSSFAEESLPPLGQITDLRTKLHMGTESSHRPSIATIASGKIYVVWLAHAAAQPEPSLLAPIPQEFSDVPKDLTFATVPGLSFFDGKQWSEPRLMLAGQRECTPLYAWCSGEDLNLLVQMTGEQPVHHIRYEADAKRWIKVVTMPRAYSYHSRFITIKDTLHIAGTEGQGVAYQRHDAKGWSQPIAMPGSKPYDRACVAVAGDGTVYLVWCATDGSEFGFATIAPDGTVTKRTIDLKVKESGFDIAIDPAGHLLLAYHAADDAIYAQSWDGKAWSPPVPVGKDSGMALGDVRMVYTNKKVLLTWQHRARYKMDRMVVSGPIRSYCLLDATGWSAPRPVGIMPREGRGIFGGGYASGFFVGLHLDASNRAHMAWGSGPMNYHCVFAELQDR